MKVITAGTPEKVKGHDGKEYTKQDCVVAESSGCGIVVLWEKDVGSLKQGISYKLVSVTVRSFRDFKYLLVGADCLIETIDDIDIDNVAEVHEDEIEQSDVMSKIVEGEICGVLNTDEYRACIECNTKVHDEDGVLAQCSKSGMTMKIKMCQICVTARVLVVANDGKHYHLTIFGKIIASIIDGINGKDLKTKLLAAPS